MKLLAKKENIYNISLILGVAVLFYLFYLFPSNKFKLIVGGTSLIILAVVEALKFKSKTIFFSYLIPGTLSLIIAFLLPTYVNYFLILFYLALLVGILWLFKFYVKEGDKFNDKEKKLQIIFRTLYFILSIILSYIIFILINSIIPHYLYATTINWTEYILFIIILFTALFSFYLFIDNIIRIFVTLKGSSEIFPKVSYRAYHSFFLSLALLIIVGGYYYINNQNNEIFTKLMIIIGLAFVTSLVITVNLKNLLGKDKEIKSS